MSRFTCPKDMRGASIFKSGSSHPKCVLYWSLERCLIHRLALSTNVIFLSIPLNMGVFLTLYRECGINKTGFCQQPGFLTCRLVCGCVGEHLPVVMLLQLLFIWCLFCLSWKYSLRSDRRTAERNFLPSRPCSQLSVTEFFAFQWLVYMHFIKKYIPLNTSF